MKKWIKNTIAISFTLLTTLLIKSYNVFAPAGDPIGEILPPPGPDKYGDDGLGLFISNILKLATLIAGLWVMINFITAGFLYISSTGDASVNEKVSKKLTSSISGLMIIVASYTIIGVISFIFFGDPAYIINLTFQAAP